MVFAFQFLIENVELPHFLIEAPITSVFVCVCVFEVAASEY